MKYTVSFFVLLFLFVATVFAAEQPKNLKFKEVPFTAVHFDDAFWSPRMKTNREISIPHNFKWCEDTGRFTNFAKAAKILPGEFQGIYFNDSDVYKLLEGTAYCLADHPDKNLEKKADDVIAWIAAAQQPNGYLNSYYELKEPDKKWTNITKHELYCCGHLIEAAVAYKRATGKDLLLTVAEKFVDHIIDVFGSEPDGQNAPGPSGGRTRNQRPLFEVPGHEEIELALIKLYDLTGKEKYLKLSEQFIDVRGDQSKRGDKIHGPYDQDHLPIREQSEIVGHAVRAVYLYSGVADVAAYTGDKGLIAAMDRLWNDVVNKKMYITGGIGARHAGEAFGDAYELPNRTAYCETCAAIGLTFWAHRMNLLHGDAKYADVMERAIYNGVLSGIGMDGKSFFYVNPLESVGNHHRQPFFDCACCPTNVVRFVSSLPGYQYAVRETGNSVFLVGKRKPLLQGGIFGQTEGVLEEANVGVDQIIVNLFASGRAELPLTAGPVEVVQKTNYPWDGKVEIDFKPLGEPKGKFPGFAIKVRRPAWLQQTKATFSVMIDGKTTRDIDFFGNKPDYTDNGGYDVNFYNAKREPIKLTISLPMETKRIVANPKVVADRGRVAIQRGPLVYCFEQCDNEVPVNQIHLAGTPRFEEEFRKDLLGGITVLKCKNADGRELTAIPYYAWDHREPGPMAVWVRQQGLSKTQPDWKDEILYKELDPSMLSDKEDEPETAAAVSFCHGKDSADAIIDGLEPKNSNDHDIPRLTFWDHKGTKEWIELDFGVRKKVSKSSIYWFDDTGKGGCRIPKSWTLSYRVGNDWKALKTVDAPKKDAYDTVEFETVETTGLRIDIQLQEKFSSGVLEWKADDR